MQVRRLPRKSFYNIYQAAQQNFSWLLNTAMKRLSFLMEYGNRFDCFKGNARSSHRRCSVRKGVLKNFAKFAGKHLCQKLFFKKVVGRRPATLLKRRLWHRCFQADFAKFLRTHFFTEHLWATAYETRNSFKK